MKIQNALYLRFNVVSTKVRIEDTIFTSPTGDGSAILRGHTGEGLLVNRATVVPLPLSYFETLSIGPATGIEPATFRSAGKRSTDWACPAAVLSYLFAGAGEAEPESKKNKV